MLAAERRNYILDVLRQEGKVHASDLSQALGVSEDTIRRDLRELGQAGLLQRVHGGALPITPASQSYHVRQSHGQPEKAAMARVAAQMIGQGQIVIMDAGTSTLAIAQQLPADLRVTIITNSPPIATALADLPAVEVILLGGRLYKEAVATVGASVVEELMRIRADLCFLGTCSIHPTGIGNHDREEAQVKRAMIAGAAEVVALVLPERLGTTAPYLVAPVRELTHLITTEAVQEEQLAPYQAAGVTVIRA